MVEIASLDQAGVTRASAISYDDDVNDMEKCSMDVM